MLEIDRRGFLRVFAVVAAEMLLLPTQVRAESIFPDGWIRPPRYEAGWYYRDGVWSSNNWGPIFENTALTRGLPRIHDDYWGAWVLDRAREELLNLPNLSTDLIQRQAIHKANVIIAKRKETESSAGYCPWLAVAQTVEPQPPVSEGEGLRTTQLKEQALEIYHAGSRLVRITLSPETLRNSFVKGAPMIADAPLGMEGNWLRSITAIREDGRAIRVTDFGNPDISLSLRAINFAYVVYPADSPDSLFNLQVNQDTAFWRYKLVDKTMVNRVITSA